MGRLILFIATLLISLLGNSQESQDVVYLKNGTIIKGSIVGQVPNEELQIKTFEGTIFTYKFTEIEKIAQEANEINLDEYGGKFSYGIALGGGGLGGLPIRIYPSPKLALEAGIYYRMKLISDTHDNAIANNGLMIAGGTNFFLKKSYDYKRERVKMDGISLKAFYSFANYPESMISAGWVHESFKKKNKNKSFIFELGLGIKNLNTEEDYHYIDNYITTEKKTKLMTYWKCNWNWYCK